MNYYNEFDPKAAAWLRALMMEGLIPMGFVDERSITEISPDDLKPYTQCHFFAGIGGWSLALRLAGWPEDEPVWTGSCPCQPFSSAGEQMGTDDPRHLWPAFRRLINRCKPPVVFGEQVASALGRQWLSGVRSNLETMGYAVGASDLCAAGVGAPHIRQRLYWVANGFDTGLEGHAGHEPNGGEPGRHGAGEAGSTSEGSHPSRRGNPDQSNPRVARVPGGSIEAGIQRGADLGGPSRLGWGASRAHLCRDGKYRRIPAEPAFFPPAHGFSGVRVGLLRGAGNAIVPELAAQFIQASEEAYNLNLSLS